MCVNQKVRTRNMERVAEAKTLIVEMICDKCSKGKMIPYGNAVLSTYPAQYPHKCENCGYMNNYPMRYPYHRLVPIEPLRKMKENEE